MSMEQGRVTGENLDVQDPELGSFIGKAMSRFLVHWDDSLSPQYSGSHRE
jgi:hypothetical protein